MVDLPHKFSRIIRIQFINFPFWFWATVILLSLMKLWLVAGQHISAIGPANHDDRLFINLADRLIHFDWLGPYNNLTLAKGPFYPMWIAFSYYIHIPLFYSQHLLYIFACLVLIIALKPILPKEWQLAVIFTVLLFNPMSFTDGAATRVIREGIYPALTLLIVAFFIGLAGRTKYFLKNILFWSFGGGLTLSAFWLTREEGIWILPFILLTTIYSILLMCKKKDTQWKQKIILFLFPFIFLFFSIKSISTINYYRYGIFNTVEFSDPNFLNAYKALTRVSGPVWFPDVPVSFLQRQIIYYLSPSFSELKPFLEGQLGAGWAKVSEERSPSPNMTPGEIKGGWFMWAFRDSVSLAGYYKDGRTTMGYYKRIADEINTARDKKQYDFMGKLFPMMPPWNSNYNVPLLKTMYKGVLYTIKLDGFSPVPSVSVGNKSSIKLFSRITRGDVTQEQNKFKVKILYRIGLIYAFLTPLLAIISSIIFFINILKPKRFINLLFILCLAITASIFTRLLILSIINITSFRTIITIYLSSLYPLVFLFILLNLCYIKRSDKS